MKYMLAQPKRDEYIHVEQILHGKSASISSTSLLVRTGAPGPRVSTGSPVLRSMTIFAFRRRFLRGVNTTLSPSIFASSGSPGRRPSFRRIGLGNTTCPLVEIRVCMVRQSYHQTGLYGANGPFLRHPQSYESVAMRPKRPPRYNGATRSGGTHVRGGDYHRHSCGAAL